MKKLKTIKKENRFLAWFKKHPKFTNILKNTCIMLLVIACVLPLQYALGVFQFEDKIVFKDENIFLIMTVAIILILIQTKNMIYGIISSFIFVLSFNFINADPIWTLDITDASYYISFAIFIVVSLIVGSLVADLQKRNKQAIENGKKVNAMYSLSSNLLDNHDRPFIYNYLVNYFKNYLKIDFALIDTEDNVYGEINVDDEVLELKKFAIEKNIVVGKNTFSFEKSNYLAFPIASKDCAYGVLFAILNEKDMPKDEIEFIQQNIFHSVVALDREDAIKEQQNAKLTVEKEKLKTALLRSLSHDLKTPLTSIKSGSDLMLSSYDKIDDETKKEIIGDIYNEACDLNEFIINLLNMTKLNQDKSLVKRKMESVDDILNEVNSKLSKNIEGKTIDFKYQNELMFVWADALMLEQVMGNLISNAIKHTKPGTTITVQYYHDENGVNFEVIDNGGGIADKDLTKIFEDFYTLAQKQDHSRGTGLGLSICKAIVNAHSGDIVAYNNDIGGATFKFNIPDKKERK